MSWSWQISASRIATVALAALALGVPASATSAPATLTLKSHAQVSGDQVMLRDLVEEGTNAPGGVIICHAPKPGTVRMLEISEVAAVLRKQPGSYSLHGAQQISVVSSGSSITAEQLQGLVESALQQAGSNAKVESVEMQAAIQRPGDPCVKLVRLRFDASINKYRAWFVTTGQAHKTYFEAAVTLKQGSAPAEINVEVKTNKPQRAIAPVLVHHGEVALLQMQGEGFTANLPVICLEDGNGTRLVRVRDASTKRIYRAEVIGRGRLRRPSAENQETR